MDKLPLALQAQSGLLPGAFDCRAHFEGAKKLAAKYDRFLPFAHNHPAFLESPVVRRKAAAFERTVEEIHEIVRQRRDSSKSNARH
jgi:hypothetical protein